MRILFLTSQLPFPPKSGGVIKSWRLVEHWSSKFQLSLISILKNDDPKHVNDFLEALPEKIRFFGKEVNRKRSPLNLLWSYVIGKPLNIIRNRSLTVKEKVREWSDQNDLIFIDHYEMGQYIPENFKGRIVFHEHNAEYLLWKRLAEIEVNPLKKLLLRLESDRIKKEELAISRKSSLILAAPNDISALKEIGVDESRLKPTYHLGEDFMLNYPSLSFSETERAILYIGTLTWEANVDGLLWFVKEIWPQIIARDGEVKFYIVGKNPDQRLVSRCRNYSNIHFTGFVEDLDEYYRKSRVFIAPLRFGSGIKVKVLNALYRGIPVVTTPIGTEGLEVEDGKNIFVKETGEDFLQSIFLLLNDMDKWNAMRDRSRSTAKGKYTWKSLLENHDQLLEKLFQECEK